MTSEMDEEIKELCKQVIAEENSTKLLELIARLNKLLEKNEFKTRDSGAEAREFKKLP
jgi:hypothetical protein